MAWARVGEEMVTLRTFGALLDHVRARALAELSRLAFSGPDLRRTPAGVGERRAIFGI